MRCTVEATMGITKQPTINSATAFSYEPSQDVFGRLPKEDLLDIIKLSSDLSCLWSIINASPTVAALFTKFGLEIVDAVVAATVPVHTQALMWALLRARASCYPSLEEARKITSILPTPMSPTEIKDPKSLRYFVSLGHKIHVLAHACIDHYIQESLTLRPSTLVEFPSDGSIEDRFEMAKGHSYQPRNTGPPSWVEEQRAIKALWRIEFFSELNTARNTKLSNWSKDDLEVFTTTSVTEFYTVEEFEVQQILTACEFVQLSWGKGRSLGSIQLPAIATKDTFDLVCAPQLSFGFREDRFQQVQQYLDKAPMSWRFQRIMAHDYKSSPLPGMPFDPYRQFGFALWDDERMTGLGFAEANRRAILKSTDYYFTWYSVLTKEGRRQRPL
jgi:hypothetical protein